MNKSIILPCYNEASNLSHILESFAKALSGRDDIGVVLVDNGSKDQTQEILTELLARPEYAFARQLHLPENKGYGHGILCGLRSCDTEWLGWTHADMQTPPEDVVRGFDWLLAEPAGTMLKGHRIGRNPLDAFFTFGMSAIASRVLGCKLTHVNAQPKLFSRAFFTELKDPPEDFSLDLYLLYSARQAGMTILEMDVTFERRMFGEAKGGGSLKGKAALIRRTWKYIHELKAKVK